MEEISRICKSLGGTLFWYGIAICLSRFCPLVPGWAETNCDPMFAIAAISFLLYCVVWLVLLGIDKKGCEYRFADSTIAIRCVAGVAAVLSCICWTVLTVYVCKSCWIFYIRMPVFWIITPYLIVGCMYVLECILFSDYAGILYGHDVSFRVAEGVAFLLIPMLIYYSIIWW